MVTEKYFNKWDNKQYVNKRDELLKELNSKEHTEGINEREADNEVIKRDI